MLQSPKKGVEIRRNLAAISKLSGGKDEPEKGSGAGKGVRNRRNLGAGTNLTGLANPDGGLHTVVYDGNHHATSDQFGSLSTAYRTSNGVLSGYTPGDGGAYALSPQDTFGLTTLVAAPAVASLTDPLNRVTREQLDSSGRPLAVTAPDGGVTQYARNSNGWIRSRPTRTAT